MVRKFSAVVPLLLLFVACVSPAFATIQSSTSIALVPNAWGRYGGAGVLPTSFPGMAFSDLDVYQVSATTLANFDTVVLYQVGDAGTVFTAQQKADINNWVYNGGKLIVYDSDACPSVDYSWLAYPFTTNNPGQLGSNAGTLTIVEENELSSNDPASPYYIDAAWLSVNTDAIGDANVMTSHDPNWFGDMEAINANGVRGWCHTYAEYGHGLILYNGIDTDYIGWGDNGWLTQIWYLELAKYWDPSNLPGTHPVAPVYWKGFLGSSDELRFWSQMTAIAKASSRLVPSWVSGQIVTMAWWDKIVGFALKLWGAISRGWDAGIASAGEAFLKGFKFWKLADTGDEVLKAERGDPNANPEISDAFMRLDDALLSLPQDDIEWWLESAGSPKSYQEWRAEGPRMKFLDIQKAPEFWASPVGHQFVLSFGAELTMLGFEVAY